MPRLTEDRMNYNIIVLATKPTLDELKAGTPELLEFNLVKQVEGKLWPQRVYVTKKELIVLNDWYYSGGNTDTYSIHQAVTERLVDIANEHNAHKVIASDNPDCSGVITINKPFIDQWVDSGYPEILPAEDLEELSFILSGVINTPK